MESSQDSLEDGRFRARQLIGGEWDVCVLDLLT
jgi:hypothetical protein